MSEPWSSAGERAADESVAALAEELVHELARSVLFFEGLVSGLGAALEAEERAIAGEELARIRRMLAVLRGFRFPPLVAGRESLVQLLEEARALAAAALRARRLRCELEVDEALALDTDRAAAVRLFALAVGHAARAARSEALVRVSGGERLVRVVAATEARPPEPARILWKSIGDHHQALRWMLAQRYARALGWTLRCRAGDEELALEIALDGKGGRT
jgi:hypothetical protein